jgi:hypothetical protein
MDTFQWLSLAGIPGLIVLIGGIIINRALKKQDDKRNATVTEYERKQEEIRRQNEQLEAQNRATMLGVQALLRDRLLQAFKHYKSQGYADYNDRDNVLNMYTQYEALGPNSVMDDYYEQFKELPIQL